MAHGFQSALSGSRFYQASGFAGGYDSQELRVQGRKSVCNHPNKGVVWIFKSESILPIATDGNG